MFGSEVLDVAVGLILVYLLLSLFATAVREALESVFKTRAVFLESGIRELLDDRAGIRLAKDFYEHPLIYSLYRGDYDEGVETQRATNPDKARERVTGANLPTYIPSAAFASALVDIVVRGSATEEHSARESSEVTIESLRSGVALLPSVHVRRALLIAIDDARGDLDRAKANVEGWFDASMQRVSGWYRRRTHYWLLLIGALSTLALNVNTITIAQHLARSKAAREVVVGRAEVLVADSAATAALARGDVPPPADLASARASLTARLEALESLNLPLGWDHLPAVAGAPVSWFMQQVVGLLLTILAITLGAPFWFDALNKVMTIKTTGAARARRAPAER